jgi:hypothetical protein
LSCNNLSCNRFCNNELADWKLHLTPDELKPEVSKVQPIMVVYFEGQIHRIPVKQGPDGLTEFTGKIRWDICGTAGQWDSGTFERDTCWESVIASW